MLCRGQLQVLSCKLFGLFESSYPPFVLSKTVLGFLCVSVEHHLIHNNQRQGIADWRILSYYLHVYARPIIFSILQSCTIDANAFLNPHHMILKHYLG